MCSVWTLSPLFTSLIYFPYNSPLVPLAVTWWLLWKHETPVHVLEVVTKSPRVTIVCLTSKALPTRGIEHCAVLVVDLLVLKSTKYVLYFLQFCFMPTIRQHHILPYGILWSTCPPSRLSDTKARRSVFIPETLLSFCLSYNDFSRRLCLGVNSLAIWCITISTKLVFTIIRMVLICAYLLLQAHDSLWTSYGPKSGMSPSDIHVACWCYRKTSQSFVYFHKCDVLYLCCICVYVGIMELQLACLQIVTLLASYHGVVCPWPWFSWAVTILLHGATSVLAWAKLFLANLGFV